MEISKYKDAHFDLGILGGGQLGRMFLQEAMNFPFQIAVLDNDFYAPSKNICAHFELGSFKDKSTVIEFGKKCKRITIEIEDVSIEALFHLRDECGVEIFPSPEIIQTIQDKGVQKDFYKSYGFPTTNYAYISEKEDLKNYPDLFPVFQKSRKSGYDGKGVTFLPSLLESGNFMEGNTIIESAVNEPIELSIIVARNKQGKVTTFEAVEMVPNHELNLLDYLISPARIPDDVAKQANQLAVDIAKKLNLFGILAVEMFLTKDNQLLINEIAPRPHNSGHHTIEACEMSQYGALIRIIFGGEFLGTALKSPVGVLNLIGNSNTQNYTYSNQEVFLGNKLVYLHHYGKKEMKLARKMGHITIFGKDFTTLEGNLNEARKIQPVPIPE